MKRVLIAVVAVVLFMAASCPPHPPNPNPTPTPTSSPTPTPTPAPTPTPTPTPGTSPRFKIVNGRFVPQAKPVEDCCNTPPLDGAKGWTLPSPELCDAMASAGFNLATARIGIYSDQGNGWGLIVPPGASRLRKAVLYCNSVGVAVLVEAGTDYWSMKPGNRQYQLYSDSCAVTQGAPPERYQQVTRAIVREAGDLDVMWSLGNEGSGPSNFCNPSQAWYDGIVAQIRAAETDFGMPHHPISNVWADHIGTPRYDFVEWHGSPESLAGLPDIGIPIVLTESDNEHPAETPERWWACADQAATTNGRLNCGPWRGEMVDAEWSRLFAHYGGHSSRIGPRVDSACLLDLSGGHGYQPISEGISDEEAQIIADATEKVIVQAPWLFRNNGNNLACNGTADDGYLRINFYSYLQANIQPRCTLAGNPDYPNAFTMEGGSVPDIDNIEFFIGAADPCMVAQHSRGIHAIKFGNYPNWCEVARGVQGVRNAFKGSGNWTFSARCEGPSPVPTPTPGPTPTPSPGPTPTPTPPPQSCGAVGGDYCSGTGQCPKGYDNLGNTFDCMPCCKKRVVPTPTPSPQPTPTPTLTCGTPDYWRVIVKSNPQNQQYDITPVACGPSVVNAPGQHNCGTSCCEESAEKGNAVCADVLYGMPVNTVIGGAVTLVQVYPDNSYTQKVAAGAGRVKICGKTSDSCVYIDVQSSPPVCNINTTPQQGCATNLQ